MTQFPVFAAWLSSVLVLAVVGNTQAAQTSLVTLDPQAQMASGITLTTLVLKPIQPSIHAYARVMDLGPLISLRQTYLTARADKAGAQAQADAADAEYTRDSTLFATSKNVSQKVLGDTLAIKLADQAKVAAAEAVQSAVEANLVQQFGSVLTTAVLAPDSQLREALFKGDKTLVQVSLPIDFTGNAPARITLHGADGTDVEALALSPASQIDPIVQGQTWLYIADKALPSGLHIGAQVPLDTTNIGEEASMGLTIAPSAIVWYGGVRWAYVQTAADQFERKLLPPWIAGDTGMVAVGTFQAGDHLVTRGAQILLSQELLPKAIATSCKDPPECDG
ncbi:MAG: hypothetical protein KGQ46_14330 [Hyphomicrobiales bacterium]|nr:hypothetical protein [Hyphomicrobiales bacterium]MDE2115016.1 hypothetical protein [Hyphomicrobiales bacterium]